MDKLSLIGARALRLYRPYRISLIFLGTALWRSVRSRGGNASVGRSTIPKHILVVRLDAIGDLIMTSLIFRELKARFPESTITVVAQAQNREILATNPFVDRILCPQRIHKSLLLKNFRQDLAIVKLYREHLQGEVVDLAINPRLDGDLYSADVLLKLVDSPRTIKYEDTSKKGLAAKIHEIAFRWAAKLPRSSPRHEVQSNRSITEYVTGVVCTTEPEVFLTEDDLAHSKELFGTIPPGAAVVCISFTAQAMRRVWPIERWAETIRLLSLERPVFALVVCTRSDGTNGRQLQSMLTTPSHLLMGATLRQVAAALQSCDLFIGLDSGLAHLAAAVHCPSVIVSPHPLSGTLEHGNSPLRFGPFSDHATIVQPEHGLPPCVSGCDAIAPHCILQIQPSQVAEACTALLDAKVCTVGGT